MSIATKRAGDLQSGDRTPWYVIVTTVREGRVLTATVRWLDGSMSERIWDDPEHEVPVLPPVTVCDPAPEVARPTSLPAGEATSDEPESTPPITPKDVQRVVMAHLRNLASEGVYVSLAEDEIARHGDERFHRAFAREIRRLMKLYKETLT